MKSMYDFTNTSFKLDEFENIISSYQYLEEFIYYFNQKIKFVVIIVDNIIMISILGIYEYIFFQTIIFKYIMITPNELIKIIMQNILSIC